MKTSGIVEILSIFVVALGCGAVCGAAAMVAPALAVLAVGVFLLFGGLVGVLLATRLEQAENAATRPTPGEPL